MESARHLIMAPHACMLAERIGLLAAYTKDTSLVNDATAGMKFEFLTSPASLKV